MTRIPAAGPLLDVGELVAGRYRVLESVPGAGPAALWRATDEVLARSVALKALPVGSVTEQTAAHTFLAAAVRSGAAVHPALARVHDAAVQRRPDGTDVALVVREWVDGRPLDVLLAGGPLDAIESVDLLSQAAAALDTVHRLGLVHGGVHPGNVLVTADGRLKLTDPALAAAAHGADVPERPAEGALRDDTRDLAAVLFALLTARWPSRATPQPGGRLPAAPGSGQRAPRPGQLRAAVPRSLDDVVGRGLDPESAGGNALTSPGDLSAAAQQAAAEVRAQTAAATRRPPFWLRRALPALLVLALLGGIGTAGWLFGLAVGDLPRRPDAVEAVVSTGSSPTPVASPPSLPLDLSRLPVRAYDPPPGDGTENPGSVPRAVDGDLATAWQTDLYKTAAFGRLKTGVGLLVDLGRSRPLSQVQVLMTEPGASLELRAADVLPATADGFRTVASLSHAPVDAVLQPAAGAVGRYWLVEITTLPPDGSGFRAGIAELRFR